MTDKKPFIRVVWEDYAENFTPEKIKRVKTYFQNKYNTSLVKIEPRHLSKTVNKDFSVITISDNIFDSQYQKKLMKEYLRVNNINTNWDLLNRLDEKVNSEISKNNENEIKNNRWSIEKIEFSNFLSYGQDNVIDYTKLNGVTVVESNPKNFAGKSVISSDLLLFLLFNKTTRTKTNIEIFNKFTEENEVFVKGYLKIDEKQYIIERRLSRKLSKSGEYKVVSEQVFESIDESGNIINLLGEQRRETEKHIQSAIGSEEDFLTTILTTGYNLEELIRTKPTERGTILSKFIGLEILKEKEDIARTMYNDWSKKLISNTNNLKQLEIDNEEITTNCEFLNSEIQRLEGELLLNETTNSEFEKLRDKYLSLKNNDIDDDLIKINPTFLESEILRLKNSLTLLKDKFNSINVTEPTGFYLEEKHDEIKIEINKINVDIRLHQNNITINERNIKLLIDSLTCPTCKREFKDKDNSGEVNKLNDDNIILKQKINELNIKLNQLIEDEKKLKILKSEYEVYERNKLVKVKTELEINQTENDISNKELNLKRYQDNSKKLADNVVYDTELNQIKTKLTVLKSTIQTIRTTIDTNKNKIINNNDKIRVNNELIKKIKSEEELIDVFKTYISIYGKNGISKTIMKTIIPLINKELFELLYDSCQFNLELVINDKNEVEFIMVDTETRVIKPLMSGSGYERTISSLALRCVLSKISPLPKPNIVVMDEVFGMIADENIDMVGEFFKKIKNYFEKIIIISHNPLIRNWSDNLILINKPNNISSIENIIINS